MSDGAVERRLVDLELRYMQLERLVEELSDVVADQARTLAELRADVALLAAQRFSHAATPLGEDGPADPIVALTGERPPHY